MNSIFLLLCTQYAHTYLANAYSVHSVASTVLRMLQILTHFVSVAVSLRFPVNKYPRVRNHPLPLPPPPPKRPCNTGHREECWGGRKELTGPPGGSVSQIDSGTLAVASFLTSSEQTPLALGADGQVCTEVETAPSRLADL